MGVRVGGQEVHLGGTKPKTVLSSLLLAGEQVVSDDRLSYVLWRDRPPRTSDAQIYTYISRLRKAFAGHASIARQGQGYAMSIGAATFDWKQFTQLSAQGRSALANRRYRLASRYFTEALDLQSGPVLTDTTEYLLSEEAAQLTEARVVSMEGQIEANLALGLYEDVVPDLFRLVAKYPFRERVRAQLMLVLHRCGRQSEAIALYHQGRRLLAEELGVDPGIQLREVYQGILMGRPELGDAA
ncbi:AfsR/SARP family transcriptional regulator [Kitasatospora sp. NPDC004669]|uniref:AfsR/SARP family transcriptional regulator n=1 Tax=Kitasatospora sp. NPDC004669 TaxID=3154555 RepID=UPI0033A949D8